MPIHSSVFGFDFSNPVKTITILQPLLTSFCAFIRLYFNGLLKCQSPVLSYECLEYELGKFHITDTDTPYLIFKDEDFEFTILDTPMCCFSVSVESLEELNYFKLRTEQLVLTLTASEEVNKLKYDSEFWLSATLRDGFEFAMDEDGIPLVADAAEYDRLHLKVRSIVNLTGKKIAICAYDTDNTVNFTKDGYPFSMEESKAWIEKEYEDNTLCNMSAVNTHVSFKPENFNGSLTKTCINLGDFKAFDKMIVALADDINISALLGNKQLASISKGEAVLCVPKSTGLKLSVGDKILVAEGKKVLIEDADVSQLSGTDLLEYNAQNGNFAYNYVTIKEIITIDGTDTMLFLSESDYKAASSRTNLYANIGVYVSPLVSVSQLAAIE